MKAKSSSQWGSAKKIKYKKKQGSGQVTPLCGVWNGGGISSRKCWNTASCVNVKLCKKREKLQRNFRANELFIGSMLSILKYILSLLSTSHQSPTLSHPLHISPPLLPSISLSTSLAPCPVTSYPRCEGDGVISIMSSEGKCERAAGGKLGVAVEWCYWFVHASALACHDTREQPCSAPEIHLLYGELSADPPIPDAWLVSARCQ